MRYLIAIALLVVGAIHLLPISGVLGGERLAALYGIDPGGPDLQILMRHRAVLFGLLGTFLVAAAFRPALRPAALAAGFVSVGSFLWLALATGGYGPALQRVVVADWVALGCLLLAAAAMALQRARPPR